MLTDVLEDPRAFILMIKQSTLLWQFNPEEKGIRDPSKRR